MPSRRKKKATKPRLTLRDFGAGPRFVVSDDEASADSESPEDED